MKIDKHILGPQVPPKTNNGKANPVSGNNFQDILEGRLRGSSSVAGSGTVAKVAETRPAPVNVRLEGLAMTESTLDTLESFGRALGDTMKRLLRACKEITWPILHLIFRPSLTCLYYKARSSAGMMVVLGGEVPAVLCRAVYG